MMATLPESDCLSLLLRSQASADFAAADIAVLDIPLEPVALRRRDHRIRLAADDGPERILLLIADLVQGSGKANTNVEGLRPVLSKRQRQKR
ncbi:hypothetical protein BRAS3843_2520024 [Bradyrhizobium sp. STM 3843]|uniref:hypothetical protein n=1 Tax=Bradyrhizobium sp. STM 3843 TaxID=551947 RepID=UPI0002404636|nr:hypothetical protein [Bradyrhizobium sp. STM 3843]CCE08009.1 hypothetical protein BRAS3843_2520024 [Bradyrhizobium sp. STM 3843]